MDKHFLVPYGDIAQPRVAAEPSVVLLSAAGGSRRRLAETHTALVRDDDVFDAVAQLVAAGEYLDQIPGRPGVNLDGGGAFIGDRRGKPIRRLYERGSPEFLEARGRGWIDPLPPLGPASLTGVKDAESLAGHTLPALLRRLYLEIGNGGFGPGYGVLSLPDVNTNPQFVTALSFLNGRYHRPVGPGVPLLLCEWRCGITSTIDLVDGQVWGYDPNPAPKELTRHYPQDMTVVEWFERWIEGGLEQPWFLQDPVTYEWRGATDLDYASLLDER